MLTRFAPSPTGHLHLGHVWAAKKAFGAAKAEGGTCLLRIEDIDHTRCRPEFRQAIYDDLAWLGFSWPESVRVQSEHLTDYNSALESLHARGLLYRCFKTRKDLPKGTFRGQPLSSDYEQTRIARGEAFAWRLNMSRCEDLISEKLTYEETGISSGTKFVDISELGDEVLARKDIGTSYHVACCHDDALQNITHIIRGIDIAPLTPIHRLLQALMGWETPIYHHHALLKNADGKKLSKRNHDTGIGALRKQGFTATQVLDMATL